MSPLEIVLLSILFSFFLVAALAVFLVRALQENRARNLDILNMFSEKGKIVFFGDSLTDFYPVQEFFPGMHIYNRGIANDRTSDLLRRIKNVTDLKPNKLFLLIGTNDIGNNIPLNKIMENITETISLVKQSNPFVKVYILSQVPVNKRANLFSFVSCKFRSNSKLKALSLMERNFCEKNKCKFIDIWPHLTDSRGNLKKEYTVEGLHLTTLGYQAISKVLKPFIKE